MVRTYGNIEGNRRILAIEKVFYDDVIMVNHGESSQFIAAPVFDKSTGESIVGVGLRFNAKRMGNYVKYNFGLSMRLGSDLHWILDLCMYPASIRSHADRAKKTVIYGSHLHALGDTHKIDIDFATQTWQDCFSLFQEKANIRFLSNVVIEPFAGELL